MTSTIIILIIINLYLVYLNKIARKEIKKLKNKLYLEEIKSRFYEELSNKTMRVEELPTKNTCKTKSKVVRRTQNIK